MEPSRIYAVMTILAVSAGGGATALACRSAPREPVLAAAAASPPPLQRPAEPLAPAPAATLAPPPPAEVEPLVVGGDVAASIVRASDGAPPATVFLPGLCSSATAYLHTFPEAARGQGGVVALEGDQPCGPPGYRSFSWDAARQHARVEAALAAAGSRDAAAGITIVGYSQGAALAEQMAARWPGRYARVVLIGAPTDPSPRSFARARALVTMSCDRDVPARMRQAALAAARAGVPARYFEMRGCSHGNVTDGEETFGAVFEWLRTNERG
jgi:pimeloyl-ACP methyl ester carboxylesterase